MFPSFSGTHSIANERNSHVRQKRLDFRQHALKPVSRAARARIVTPELFNQFLVAVDDAITALHMRFGIEILSDACSSVGIASRHPAAS
jgi:hypothetical protein